MINECGASRIQDKEEGQLKTGNIGIGYVFMTTLLSSERTRGGCVKNEWFVHLMFHFHQLPVVSDEGLHGISCWGWMDGFNFQMWFLAGCLGAIGKSQIPRPEFC